MRVFSQAFQSRHFWILRHHLAPFTLRFLPALKRMFRYEERRIIVRATDNGFTAALARSAKDSANAAHWHSIDARWDDGHSIDRLVRMAHEIPVELVLQQELVLTQSVVLPETALINIRDAITYGFPSWSPFAAEELYLNGSIERIEAGQVTVRLDYVRKAKADPLLAELHSQGLAPDRIVMDAKSNSSVDLPTRKIQMMRRARRVDVALYLGVLVLTMILCVVRISDLSHRLADVDAALRSELQSYRQEEALRAGFDLLMEKRLAVSRRRAAEPSVSDLLAALAQHLPEDASLRAVELTRNRGRLEVVAGDGKNILEDLRAITFLQQLKIEAAQRSGIVAITFQIASRKP